MKSLERKVGLLPLRAKMNTKLRLLSPFISMRVEVFPVGDEKDSTYHENKTFLFKRCGKFYTLHL